MPTIDISPLVNAISGTNALNGTAGNIQITANTSGYVSNAIGDITYTISDTTTVGPLAGQMLTNTGVYAPQWISGYFGSTISDGYYQNSSYQYIIQYPFQTAEQLAAQAFLTKEQLAAQAFLTKEQLAAQAKAAAELKEAAELKAKEDAIRGSILMSEKIRMLYDSTSWYEEQRET